MCNESHKALSRSEKHHHTHVYSFTAILDQEVQFEEDGDEKCLLNLSKEVLKNKIQTYNKLFSENVRFV